MMTTNDAMIVFDSIDTFDYKVLLSNLIAYYITFTLTKAQKEVKINANETKLLKTFNNFIVIE